MIGKDVKEGAHLVPQLTERECFLQSLPDDESARLSDYALYLYLTFEDGLGDEWWPLEDGPLPPRQKRVRLDALQPKFRRTGR
jgi:hypothetical protein